MGKKAKKNKGKVFLTGVGPGDEQLMTVGALNCLKSADVIIYDHLISKTILRFKKLQAKLICVGKSPGKHIYPQEKINELLLKQAKNKKNVVRLKGGDPFLFGRGAEEALFLKSRGVECVVVPGLTSGVAVPELFGIPLTHRGLASLVTFVTGHEDPFKKSKSVEWTKLAKLQGTLVVFMGMKNLSKIREQLILHGKPEKTPIAIIQWGTFNKQKAVIGTLENIERKVKDKKIEHPAIIVIGEVVKLQGRLAQSKKMPLSGEKILLTRPANLFNDFSRKLQEQCAAVCILPLIETVRNKKVTNKTIVEKINNCDWIIFTSKTAVDICFEAIKAQNKDSRVFGDCKIAVIGKQTQKMLQAKFIEPDLMPHKFCMEGLVQKFKKIKVKGKRVFIPHSTQARDLLTCQLSKQGAVIDEAFIYGVQRPFNTNKTALKKIILSEKPTLITFTSSSCVHEFMKLLKNETGILRKQKFAVIGPVTNNTLKGYGFKAKIIAREFTEDGLVRAIIKANS